MRTNFFIWAGVLRFPQYTPPPGDSALAAAGITIKRMGSYAVPTVVIDADLRSWALPFAIHAGGPLLGRLGFHFRIGPVNIGWSKL